MPAGSSRSARRLGRRARRDALGLVTAAACVLQACATPPNGSNINDRRAEGAALFGAASTADPSGAQAGSRARDSLVGDREQWVIGLRRVTQNADRQRLIDTVRQRTGLRDIRIEERVGVEQLVTGGWDDLADGEAAERLERIREIEIDGASPFAGAVLLPPEIEPATGANAPWDLRNAAGTSDAEITLQFEQFQVDAPRPTRRQVERMRRRVEERVAELRTRDVEAYFYHTPSSSAITLGLFSPSEIDTNPTPGFSPRHAPRAKKLLERFPTQFYNGEPTDPPLPTTPVRIPR